MLENLSPLVRQSMLCTAWGIVESQAKSELKKAKKSGKGKKEFEKHEKVHAYAVKMQEEIRKQMYQDAVDEIDPSVLSGENGIMAKNSRQGRDSGREEEDTIMEDLFAEEDF